MGAGYYGIKAMAFIAGVVMACLLGGVRLGHGANVLASQEYGAARTFETAVLTAPQRLFDAVSARCAQNLSAKSADHL